jgi:hypothetical protein
MLPYAAVMIPSCLSLLAARTMSLQLQRRIAYSVLLIVTIFAGARGYVGTDTSHYHHMFDNFGAETFSEGLEVTEPLFVALMQLSALISDSSFVFVGLIALLQGAILLRVMKVSDRPADALAIYIALFFINFEFNILRGGTAVLLLLAARQVWHDKDGKWFYFFLIAAVLAHYSSAVTVLPMIYMREKRPTARLAVLLLVIPLVFAASYFLIGPEKYASYLDDGQKNDAVPYGVGFFIYILMYVLLYLSVISRKNFLTLTALFLFWISLRWTSNYILYVDRVELIVNALLLYGFLEKKLVGWQRQVQGLAVTGLIFIGLNGTLSGLENVDNSTRGAHVPNAATLTYDSPFVPYKFFWDE